MSRYIAVIIQTLPWYLWEIFINRFRILKRVGLPKKIDNYILVKSLSAKGFPFETGLYKTPEGEKVVIKVWEGKMRNIYYFNLLHQIEIMKILSKVQKRLPKSRRHGFSLPEHINSKVEKNRVLLIMTRQVGVSMAKVGNAEKQFEIYEKCLQFLKSLSQNLTKEERQIITTKSVWDFIFLYPLIAAAAISVNPSLSATVLRGIILFINGLPFLTKMRPNVLVHGDLHPDNIIVAGKNKYSLVDVENMRLCYDVYEPITTVSLKGNSDKLKQLIINKHIKPQKINPHASKAFGTLIVNNATHNLSGDKNEAGVESYKKTFELAFSI